MKLTLTKMIKHAALIFRHKWRVFINCQKCGLPWRAIVHDLSKFSPTEFFESARYYQGNRSPIGVCRRDKGVSYAWLHHKGRNKHHLEYWTDPDCTEQPIMPYKYAAECICDKLAATRTYLGKNYDSGKPLEHFRKYGNKVATNQKNLDFIDAVFVDCMENGEKYVLRKKYLKEKYREICG